MVTASPMPRPELSVGWPWRLIPLPAARVFSYVIAHATAQTKTGQTGRLAADIYEPDVPPLDNGT